MPLPHIQFLVRNGGHAEEATNGVFTGETTASPHLLLELQNKPQPNTQRNKTHVLEKPVPTGE